jgi:hypothetical protein
MKLEDLPLDILGYFLTFLSIRTVAGYVAPLNKQWNSNTKHHTVCDMRVTFDIDDDFPKKPFECQYKVYCIIDKRSEYIWEKGDTLPTTCPNNPSHDIDSTKTKKIGRSDIETRIESNNMVPFSNTCCSYSETIQYKADEIIIKACLKYRRLQNIYLGIEEYEPMYNMHGRYNNNHTLQLKPLQLSNTGLLAMLSILVSDITEIDLSGYHTINDLILEEITKRAPAIQSLDISLASINHFSLITGNGLLKIAANCQNLRKLNLSSSIIGLNRRRSQYQNESEVTMVPTEIALLEIAKNNPLLGELTIQYYAVTNEQLLIIGEYCPNLTHLDISNCPHLTPDGVTSFQNLRPRCEIESGPIINNPNMMDDMGDMANMMNHVRVGGMEDIRFRNYPVTNNYELNHR